MTLRSGESEYGWLQIAKKSKKKEKSLVRKEGRLCRTRERQNLIVGFTIVWTQGLTETFDWRRAVIGQMGFSSAK
jgi:hypothetical protein